YLPESHNKIYTHAENGYLQVASETGIGGVILLAAAICACGTWCVVCLRHARQPNEIRLFGAAAAGLAASLTHSAVDFVWYIPACMSITTVLAGCLLRLSQLVRTSETDVTAMAILPRGRWLERGAAALMVAAWSVHVYVGPAMAAIHWDRYLRASVANSRLSRQQMAQLVAGQPVPSLADCEPLNELMIRHLEQVIQWDPYFARAHLRLADKYRLKFEMSQPDAANAMGLAQLRDAAMTAGFSSTTELHAWLNRAFGTDIGWLRLAAAEAHRAVALCPLQGEGYVFLADLCFLESADASVAQSYVARALSVRPYGADVLYAVGEQARRSGDIEAAIQQWSKCFGDVGPHQLRIVFWLAGGMPVHQFLSTFQPDWGTLRHIWSRYREFGQPQDIEVLLAYTMEATLRETQQSNGANAARIWYMQSALYADVDQHEQALACLERAYGRDFTNYSVRQALAKALEAAGRFAEAETHLRWCLARRPADKSLSNLLVKITRERLAHHEPFKSSFDARRPPLPK
ncbi:MAG: hypothetical protein WD229_12565, partial [Pirellulales bacterium]